MTNDLRHLFVAAGSGLALILLAALASAIHVTLSPEVAPGGFLAAWAGINLVAWITGWVLLRRESATDMGVLLIALGDALLPLNLYLVSFKHISLVRDSLPLSAAFAAMVALVYYIFADLAGRRVPLTWRPHRAYLFIACTAAPIYWVPPAWGFSLPTTALLLVGVAGLATALCRLLDPPLRRHYAAAGMLLILVLLGRFAAPFVERAPGLLLVGIYVSTGLLLALAWWNRDVWLGKLLSLAMWATLTLALAATLYFLAVWGPPSLVIAAVWVALLILIWALVQEKSLVPLTEAAYWFAWVWGAVVVASLGPLWRRLAALYSAGLQQYRLTGPSWLIVEMLPDDLWRMLTLLLIALAWIGGLTLRRTQRELRARARWWEIKSESVMGAIPLVLLLAVVSTVGISAFRAASWVVALLVVTGTVYRWAGAWSGHLYPPRSLTIVGYAALVLAVLTASFHLHTALVALAAVTVIFFMFSEWTQSLTAYVLCLIHLVGGALVVSFGVFPRQSTLVLALFYLTLLLFAYWWIYRARAAQDPERFSALPLVSLIGTPAEPVVETRSWRISIKTLITVTLTLFLAVFIIAVSLYRRQLHPIPFLILAATYGLIRYGRQSTWPAPAQRYADGLWLAGSELVHVAIGLLLYGGLWIFQVRPDFYGLAFAGLSLVYLVGYGVISGEPRSLTRTSLRHFVHVFSLAAVILTILYCPLGMRAALAWLLVATVHLSLSADEEARWGYPLGVLKVLGYAAVAAAAIHLVWPLVPGLAAHVPLPEMLARETSPLFLASFLFALGVVFIVIMNRDQSLGHGLLAISFMALAVMVVATAGSALLYGSLLYVYLLVLSRVQLRRTSEVAFNPRLPQVSLWLANALLLLWLGVSALSRQFDLPGLAVITLGFMVLSQGWEQMVPISVRARFGSALLVAYTLAHATAAVTVYAFLRAYGLTLSYYGLAFAALAAMHLVGYWLVQRYGAARLREKILWIFSHGLALLSFSLAIAFASRHLNGSLAALLLALVSLVFHLLSGRVVYWHVTAYFLITSIAFIGRAWGILMWEFYLIPVAVYGGWVFYRQSRREKVAEGERGRRAEASPSSVRLPADLLTRSPTHILLKFGLAVAIFLFIVVYPAWRFLATGDVIHLILSGLGAVATIHLFVIAHVHSGWLYLISVVLVCQAIYITVVRWFDTPILVSLVAIGILLIADLRYLAARHSAPIGNEEKERKQDREV